MGMNKRMVAEYLLREEPLLRDGRYALYLGAPIGSLIYRGRMTGKCQPEDRVDLLVCRGARVVLGISCSDRSRNLLRERTPDLSAVALEDDEGLPFGNQEDEEPSPVSLVWLRHDIQEKLTRRTGRSLMSCRQRMTGEEPPEAGGYALAAVAVEEVLPRVTGGAALEELLRRHWMLDGRGEGTLFGSEHGLFFRCELDGAESLRLVPMGAVDRIPGLQGELERMPLQREGTPIPLETRLDRLRGGLPGDDRSAAAALEQLLCAPLEALYLDHPRSLEALRALLGRPEWEQPPAIATYRDGLVIAQRLWRSLGEDQRFDSGAQRRSRGLFGELILLLADPFLMPEDAVPAPEQEGRRSLARRLGELPGAPWKRYPIFRMPLSHYYRAASCLSGSGYGQWLYQREIVPLFRGDKRPESAFHLMILARHCRNLWEDPQVKDWDETFPLLYALLVAPIVGNELT